MKHQTLFTNQFDQDDAREADKLLEKGYAVRFESSCIGHTRAAIVESEGKRYLLSLGCKEVKIADNLGFTDTYYCL